MASLAHASGSESDAKEPITTTFHLQLGFDFPPVAGEPNTITLSAWPFEPALEGIYDVVLSLPTEIAVGSSGLESETVFDDLPAARTEVVWPVTFANGSLFAVSIPVTPTEETTSPFDEEVHLFVHPDGGDVSRRSGEVQTIFVRVGESEETANVADDWTNDFASLWTFPWLYATPAVTETVNDSGTPVPVAYAEPDSVPEAEPLSAGIVVSGLVDAGTVVPIYIVTKNTGSTPLGYGAVVTLPVSWTLLVGSTTWSKELQPGSTYTQTLAVNPLAIDCTWQITAELAMDTAAHSSGVPDIRLEQQGGIFPCTAAPLLEDHDPVYATPYVGLRSRSNVDLTTPPRPTPCSDASCHTATPGPSPTPGRPTNTPTPTHTPTPTNTPTPTETPGEGTPTVTLTPTPNGTPDCFECELQCGVTAADTYMHIKGRILALAGYPDSYLAKLHLIILKPNRLVQVPGGPSVPNKGSQPPQWSNLLADVQLDHNGRFSLCVEKNPKILFLLWATDLTACSPDWKAKVVRPSAGIGSPSGSVPDSRDPYWATSPIYDIDLDHKDLYGTVEKDFGDQIVETTWGWGYTHAAAFWPASMMAYEIRNFMVAKSGMATVPEGLFIYPYSTGCDGAAACYRIPEIRLGENMAVRGDVVDHEYGHRAHNKLGTGFDQVGGYHFQESIADFLRLVKEDSWSPKRGIRFRPDPSQAESHQYYVPNGVPPPTECVSDASYGAAMTNWYAAWLFDIYDEHDDYGGCSNEECPRYADFDQTSYSFSQIWSTFNVRPKVPEPQQWLGSFISLESVSDPALPSPPEADPCDVGDCTQSPCQLSELLLVSRLHRIIPPSDPVDPQLCVTAQAPIELTPTPTFTAIPTCTPTPQLTPSATPTLPTVTPGPSPTVTTSPTPSLTSTHSPTATPTFTATPSPTPTP